MAPMRTARIVFAGVLIFCHGAKGALPPFADDRTGISTVALEHIDSLLVSSDASDAQHIVQRMLVRHPRDSRLWVRLAYLYEEVRKPEAAERAYRKALDIQPDSYGTSFNLARLLAIEDRPEEALDILADQVEIGANDADYWYLTGLILLGVGFFEESVAALERAALALEGVLVGTHVVPTVPPWQASLREKLVIDRVIILSKI